MSSDAIQQRAIDLFWCNVEKTDGCWLYKGYWTIALGKGETCTAAKFSWVLAEGDVPDGMFVRRSCKQKRCVRPGHLYLSPANSGFRSLLDILPQDSLSVEPVCRHEWAWHPLDEQDRFWSKVEKSDYCWMWTASCTAQGYGQFVSADGSIVGAHRYCYEITKGPIPEGLKVLHTCDVRACVRPDHLYAGTHEDNMRDVVERQRHARIESSEPEDSADSLVRFF
jgi:hypothetical protein